jgi:hypothetical protein
MNHILHKQIYAGLREILKDPSLYYQSTIDKGYNKFTEKGEQAVLEWIKFVAPKMIELENAELDAKAKELVIKELKR